jgi:hypothetical protein
MSLKWVINNTITRYKHHLSTCLVLKMVKLKKKINQNQSHFLIICFQPHVTGFFGLYSQTALSLLVFIQHTFDSVIKLS